jgi:hypothetical protein
MEADRAVGVDCRVGQVALLVLDDRELADPRLERGVEGQALRETAPNLVRQQLAPDVEDLAEELVPTDGVDRGNQPGRQRVVVRRKGDLRAGRDVVEVSWPADSVANRPPIHETGRLERAELLEHAGPTRAEGRREVLRRAGTLTTELNEDVPAK